MDILAFDIVLFFLKIMISITQITMIPSKETGFTKSRSLMASNRPS